MLYDGKTLSLQLSDGVLELRFDNPDSSVNVLNRAALAELEEALDAAASAGSDSEPVQGLVITSGKSGFIAGADITEFLGYFAAPDAELRSMLDHVNGQFNRLGAMPYPTIAAINGVAQGGGFEICLACDYRLAAPAANVGLPEVKLGIMPGWGGSVRLPRLIGADNAFDWMCTGASKKAAVALADGAVDAVVEESALMDTVRQIVAECHAGKRDWQARRDVKHGPLRLSPMESAMAFESARGVVGAKAGPHYPSPLTIIATVEKHAGLPLEEALPYESESFVKLGKTDVAANLVGIFLKDQALKRIAREQVKAAQPVKQAAVLGAGIMGGGVAYQSASNGVPIIMKDIRQEAIEAGLGEAGKLLQKQLERGAMKPADMGKVLTAIQPALSYGEFEHVDLVVEAVVENAKVKQSVLADVEQQVGEDTILTTNTSTISVNLLSSALKRPENFCGMHFFNPVHRMPLVEVIRADSSSDAAIATTVAYAQAMRKTPIVVNDCPGFLVNRILFAYLAGFTRLVADGGDIVAIDKAMERFGWPMGPAWLLDVIGMDTSKHAAAVMAEGFPDRMGSDQPTIIDALHEADRLGQKNGKGFYRYEADKRGKPKKLPDEALQPILQQVQSKTADYEAQTIVDRHMIPLCIEAARCLEDGIVGTPSEVDMGLVYGIGFPPFRGGALQYVDQIGLQAFCEQADQYQDLGPLYHPTDTMRSMAAEGRVFYDRSSATGGQAGNSSDKAGAPA